MKILFLTTHLNIGGIPRYVMNLAKGFELQGHQVYVASRGGSWEDRLTEAGIPTLKIPLHTKSIASWWIGPSLVILFGFLKKTKIDLIHCNTRVAQFLGFLLWKFKKIPYVSTFHGYYHPRMGRMILKCEGVLSIAISADVEKHMSRDLRIDPSKIRLVYNGIDERVYFPPLEKEISKKRYQIDGNPVVGIIARLTAEKNHQLLIDAFALLVRDYPRAVLLVVGEGRLAGELEAQANELGLHSRIRFMKNAIPSEIIPAFDVSVLPSFEEGFGLFVLESLILGIPVVVSDRGGLKEIIEHGVNGLVLRDCQDKHELYRDLKNLIEDFGLRKRLIENGKKTVRERFSLNQMLDGTWKVYEEALRDKRES